MADIGKTPICPHFHILTYYDRNSIELQAFSTNLKEKFATEFHDRFRLTSEREYVIFIICKTTVKTSLFTTNEEQK